MDGTVKKNYRPHALPTALAIFNIKSWLWWNYELKKWFETVVSIVVMNAAEGSLCFKIFILHNSRWQVLCGSCKKLLYFTSVLLYLSGLLGSLMPALLSVEKWVPLKPVLGSVRDVARIHYPSGTDSIKSNLQLSCNVTVIIASAPACSSSARPRLKTI
jgi:hypothetical protein